MRTLRSRIRRWLRSHWICGTWEAPAPLGLCVSRWREVFQVNFSGKEESINEISEDRRTAGFPGHPQGGAYHVNWHHMKNHMDSPEGHEVEWWRSQSEIQAVSSERKENVHTRAVNSSWPRESREKPMGRALRQGRELRLWTPCRGVHLLLPLEMQRKSIPLTAISPHFLLNFIYLFIYFWLWWVFVAVRAFSLVVVGEFLLQWLLLWSTSSRACGVQQLWGKGSIVVAPRLKTQAQSWWYTGLVALRQLGSPQIRDGIRACCISRWILYHWATKEAPSPHC